MTIEADLAGEMADMGRLMEREQALVMSELLKDINELVLINETMSPLTARKAVLTERIKQGMGLQDLTELADGETGVVAKLQDRAGTPLYDLVSAVKTEPATIFESAMAGMLRLDHAMFKRFREQAGATWADQLAQFEMPGNGTTALIVEKRDA